MSVCEPFYGADDMLSGGFFYTNAYIHFVTVPRARIVFTVFTFILAF